MKRLVLQAIVMAFVLAGCQVTTANRQAPTVQETRQSSAGDLLPGESVTVVRVASSVGDNIVECVGKTIGQSDADIDVVPPKEFRNGMFPWFEPATTPITVDGLAKLIKRTVVKQRIEAFGVRYVVAIGGESTERTSTWGGATGTMGVGAVLGGVSTTKSTRLAAVILDLKQARPVSNVTASAKGGSGIGLLIIIPYAVATRDPDAVTCQAVATRVVAFLRGDSE